MMDDCRFDNLTRMFGAIQDRRAAVKHLAGASAALVSLARADLGLAAEDDVLVEGCRLTGENCKRNNQCCSNNCHRKKDKKKHKKDDRDKNKHHKKDRGTCQCRGNGKSCTKDAACCRGRCDQNEKRCRCIKANDICNRDEDCCNRRKCVAAGGQKFCKNR